PDRRRRERGARGRDRRALARRELRDDGGAGDHGLGGAGSVSESVEDLLRRLAPQVLGVLVRRHGRFDACEDAVQEALLAAALQGADEGVPDNPYGWLITVATRRLTDEFRAESARARREETVYAAEVEPGEVAGHDDALTLLFLCCHPALSGPSQV